MVRAAMVVRWRPKQGCYGLNWLSLGVLGLPFLSLSASHVGIHPTRGGSKAARSA